MSIPMKEAIVVLLDVGKSMTRGETSRLEGAVKAVHMLVQQKILFKPKDDIGVVLFGSEETNNDLSATGYDHVDVIRELAPPDIELLRDIQQITPGGHPADWEEVNRSGLDVVLSQFEKMECKLNVIGVDFEEVDSDDEDGGSASMPSTTRSAVKAANEKLLREIVESVDGVVVANDQALELMSYFRAKSVLQRPTFRGALQISPLVKIPIYMYTKTMEQKAPTKKKISRVAEDSADPGDCEVKMDRIYVSLDDLDTNVPEEERVRGFKYGKSLVPFTKEDEEATKYRALPELLAIGFTKASSVPRHHYITSTQVCVPNPADKNASAALSALIHALAETESVMITRYVKTRASAPALGVMMPVIKPDLEYLIYQKLPFAEDLRHFPFAPLDVTRMKQGQAPNKAQLAAAELLINSLNLMTAGRDEDGDPMEALKPRHTYNPVLQRLYQCIQTRALVPGAPLPPLDPIIEKYVNPDEELFGNAKAALDNFKSLFPVEAAGSKRTYWADMVGREDVQLDSYIPDAKRQKVADEKEFMIDNIAAGGTSEVGSVHPVKDFNDMVTRRDVDLVEKAIKQMQDRILAFVNDSIRDQLYGKAMECLVCLREGCVKEEEPELFNTFLKSMRNLFEGKRRDEFWTLVAARGVSLINDAECEESDVSVEEAANFHSAPAEEMQVEAEPAAAEEDDEDDLFGMVE